MRYPLAMIVIVAVELDNDFSSIVIEPELIEEAPLVARDEDSDFLNLLLLVQIHILNLVIVPSKLGFEE